MMKRYKIKLADGTQMDVGAGKYIQRAALYSHGGAGNIELGNMVQNSRGEWQLVRAIEVYEEPEPKEGKP